MTGVAMRAGRRYVSGRSPPAPKRGLLGRDLWVPGQSLGMTSVGRWAPSDADEWVGAIAKRIAPLGPGEHRRNTLCYSALRAIATSFMGRGWGRRILSRHGRPCAGHPQIASFAAMRRGGFVYIMTNRPNGTLYVGVTKDIAQRAFEHRQGLGDGFTRRYGLKRLVWYEPRKRSPPRSSAKRA